MQATTVEIISHAGVAVPLLGINSIRWRLAAGVEPVTEDFFFKIADKGKLDAAFRGPRGGRRAVPFVREENGTTVVEHRPGGERQAMDVVGDQTLAPGTSGLEARMNPVTLRIRSGRGFPNNNSVKQIEFTNLFIVNFPPGPNKNIGVVTLADRRFWWKYGYCLRRFNMTLRTGTKRVFDDGDDLRPALDHFGYRQFSIEGAPGGGVWKASDIIDKVFEDCMLPEMEARKMNQAPDLHRAVDANVFPDSADITSDNIEFDDRADQAMSRALSQCPGLNIMLDRDGRVALFHEHDASEHLSVPPARNDEGEQMLEIENAGHLDFVENSMTRPASVRVNFTYEAEVKFKFQEAGGFIMQGVDAPAQKTIEERLDKLLCDNVIALPDHNLLVGDTLRGRGNRQVATGTWLEINQDLFNAWGVIPFFPEGNNQLTFDMIQRGAVPFLDVWGAIGLAGMGDPAFDWMGRIASIAGHWRRTFRLPQLFVHRIADVKPWRACMLDPVTGTRAKASVYADYSIVPNQRNFMATRNQIGGNWNGTFVMEVKDKWAEKLKDNKAVGIPAMINIVDGEMGVFHVEYLPDAGRMYSQFIPGVFENNTAPVSDLRHGQNLVSPISWDAARRGFTGMPKVSDSWNATFIMTCIPGAPNNLGQCYVEEVMFADIANELPFGVGNADSFAPSLEVRVPVNVATARVGWTDAKETTTKKIFGIGAPGNVGVDDAFDVLTNRMKLSHEVRSMLVNRGEQRRDQTGENIRDIAHAYALRAYMEYIDRIEGSASSDLQSPMDLSGLVPMGVGPTGHLTSVSFEVSPDGKATTSYQLPDKISPLPFFSFLDPGTRAVVLGLATAGMKK